METDRPSEKGFQTACLRIGTDRLISTILNCIKPTMVKTKRNAEALLFENDALQNYLLAADAAASAADAAASAEDAAASPAADAASVAADAADAASVTAVDAALVAEAAASAALSPQAVKNKDIRAAAKRDFFILNT
ncbi:hypothetical protein [Neisseria elongata]|uniref:hypothetical protein n=1 Tax=Neisseria elongata TaxID=495 RepID=UPI00131EB820|nr:hypothetical protein [Neisseria elongata]